MAWDLKSATAAPGEHCSHWGLGEISVATSVRGRERTADLVLYGSEVYGSEV
jgi:hypothetical protein